MYSKGSLMVLVVFFNLVHETKCQKKPHIHVVDFITIVKNPGLWWELLYKWVFEKQKTHNNDIKCRSNISYMYFQAANHTTDTQIVFYHIHSLKVMVLYKPKNHIFPEQMLIAHMLCFLYIMKLLFWKTLGLCRYFAQYSSIQHLYYLNSRWSSACCFPVLLLSMSYSCFR